MPVIDLIAGARPNFMKIAPILHALRRRRDEGGALAWRLIHTGQHYDRRMSGDFFTQLDIPEPDLNLEAGSGTQAEQTGAIMVRYEQAIAAARPDLCLVVGDVTSTMACAITAQKAHVPVAHVEAGIRSGDWTMPEEINRLATDAVTNWFFTTTRAAGATLQRSGVEERRIFFVGNTMIDTLLANRARFVAPVIDGLELRPRDYVVATLHRPANVDHPAGLAAMVRAIAAAARGRAVIFPAHPRTARVLTEVGELPANIHLIDPQPYLQFNHLVANALAVVTDSGGVTEEATVLGVPCMTLRDTTERPETVEIGTNELLGVDPAAVAPAFDRLFAGRWKSGATPELWDGRAGERIVSHLESLLIGRAG